MTAADDDGLQDWVGDYGERQEQAARDGRDSPSASRLPHIIKSPAPLALLPTLPSHHVVCHSLLLSLRCPASPSSCHPITACLPKQLLNLIVALMIILLTTHFFRTQQIVNLVVGTITITSMWTRQSSHPPTNLFIIMLLSSSSLMLCQFYLVMDI
jgi:hypothetical protein